METSRITPNPLDLTGQLSILDLMPKFTGNYSSVFLGGLNGNFVAIKVIKPTGTEESVKRKLLREITLWASTSHPNIQPFYGFASDRAFGSFGALVSPWCLNGDANGYLQQNGSRMVMAEKIGLWKGVIEGVAYLHWHNPIIVHGDLKPGNVLIDDLGVPRVCDFGLARVFLGAESTGVTTTSEHTGTARYLAPELVDNEENVYPTAASDLYALGCLGLEFIYDQKPYYNRANNLRGQIVRDIKRGLPPAPSLPHQGWACQHTWSLIKQLWSLEPSHRPSASNAIYVLNHTARSIPATVVQSIVLFSASLYGDPYSASKWIQRTTTLLTLSLVSKSFYACATPVLYREIRLSSKITLARLSSLAFTLYSSVKNPRTHDHLPNGYGTYTRTLLLGIDKDVHALSADIPNILHKMTRLHVLVIHAADELFWKESVLRTVLFGGIRAPSLIFDREMVQALLCFQRLVMVLDHDAALPQFDASQMRQASLLPNLQEISLQGDMGPIGILQVITMWVMPCLKSLSCDLRRPSPGPCPAFISLLQVHGPLLWYLSVHLHEVDPPSIPGMLSLCCNLRSFLVTSFTYIQLSSFPPHPTLEILNVACSCFSRVTYQEAYLAQFDDFTTSWRMRFANLRGAKFSAPWTSFSMERATGYLEMNFRTGDEFYTLIDGDTMYKRWEGSWIGAGPHEMTDWPGLYDPTDGEYKFREVKEEGTAMTSKMMVL